MNPRKASAIRMWAVIIRGNRTDWIQWMSLSSTRRGALKAYSELWTDPEEGVRKLRNAEIRMARVTVAEVEP